MSPLMLVIAKYINGHLNTVDWSIESLFIDLPCREEEGADARAGNRYRRLQRRGYPPVTPNACAKDAVVSHLFDQAWGEVRSQRLALDISMWW